MKVAFLVLLYTGKTVLDRSPVYFPLTCNYFPLPWKKRNLLISVSFPLTFIAPHCYVIIARCYQ